MVGESEALGFKRPLRTILSKQVRFTLCRSLRNTETHRNSSSKCNDAQWVRPLNIWYMCALESVCIIWFYVCWLLRFWKSWICGLTQNRNSFHTTGCQPWKSFPFNYCVSHGNTLRTSSNMAECPWMLSVLLRTVAKTRITENIHIQHLEWNYFSFNTGFEQKLQNL